MEYQGTSGDDNFQGTKGKDLFSLSGGGADVVQGAGGDDVVNMHQTFDPGCRFDGGAGFDALDLDQVPAGYTFTSTNFINFEDVAFFGSGPTLATLAADCCTAGHAMQIYLGERGSELDASAVAGSLTTYLGGSGPVQFTSGLGDDYISSLSRRDRIDGGAGNDFIVGNGRDTLTGGSGADTFAYYVDHGNRHVERNSITDFNVSEDKLLITSSNLHRFSQLAVEDDGQGGTIVRFQGGQSADLQHVAFGTLSSSDVIFAQPSSQTMPGSGQFWTHPASEPPMHMASAIDDVHIMTHAAIV